MATFSKATFDAASYLAFRPSYPQWLYEEILAFHRLGRRKASASSSTAGPAPESVIPFFRSAWDLGCGPGISSLPLQPKFDHVTGLEPSANMVANAIRLDSSILPSSSSSGSSESNHPRLRTLTPALRRALLGDAANPIQKLGSINYIQGHAEDLAKHCPPASADLIVAGQAAHWFNYEKLWPALARSIAPGGTVAFWGYAEFSLPDFPQSAPLISAFMSDPNTMSAEAKALTEKEDFQGGITNVGAFFERPGRSILDRGLVDLPWPWQVEGAVNSPDANLDRWDRSSATRTLHSVVGLPSSSWNPAWPPVDRASDEAGQTMDLVVDWNGLEKYLRTASAVANFLHQHPNDADQYAGRDVVQRFIRQLRTIIPADELRLRWPVSLLMLKAK
ncbi:trans-aconitate methyltransferase 1 [Tilletia horrida]|uniref:Trans-aconitate methyltransferase 1 n=1 Tax=Tilletia horrida TaxID=155126 RepID=A0AAN6JQW4_9BASI|nr:trans-aconitate methyltransferase 1 [Tilletia horrida]KAK0548755.1 trans-aconitate methyltransferase 1 [Tilletia horrida]KAK0563860.1 trans-aconitate methyltransferase 1 [Tilletia horrida]